MHRRALLLCLGTLAVITAGCSSSTDSSAGTNSPSGGSSSTSSSGASGGTSSTTSGTKTSISRPAKIEKVDKTKLPSKAQAAPKGFDLSQDESDCIDYVVYTVYTNDPSTGTDDATVAGIAGGAVAACVPAEKVADSIIADMKASSGAAANLTEDQYACIKKEIVGTDSQSLAIFIGALAYGEEAMLKPFADALSQACQISI